MADASTDRAFLGTGWSFPPEFDRGSRTVATVSEEQDIKESLWIILSTSPGERVMNPAFGCGIKSKVFENLSESAATEIRELIDRAILFFEPRIIVDGIELAMDEGYDPHDLYSGVIKIQINYTIRATNTRSNMVYPFYVNEGTNLPSIS